MKKKKKLVGWLIGLGVIGILLFHIAVMYVEHISVYTKNPAYVGKWGKSEQVLGEITDTTPVTQTFKLRNTGLDRIRIFFGTYARENTNHLKVELLKKDSKEVIESWELSCKEIVDLQEHDFELQTRYVVEGEEEFLLKLSSKDGKVGNSVTVFSSGKSSHGMDLRIGKEPKKGDLFFKVADGKQIFLYWYFALPCVVLLGMLAALWWFGYQKKWSPQRLFLIVGGAIGILYLFIMPPFSAPDEPRHFYTAYAYSNQLLGQEPVNEKGKVYCRKEDEILKANHAKPSTFTYRVVAENLFSMKETEGTTIIQEDPLSGVPFLVYLPQIIGITLARILQLGNVPLLFMGRLFGLLFYLLCGYWAIRLIPFGKMMMFIVPLLPISLELAGSYSYDSVINASSFLFVAYCLYLAYEKEKVGLRDWGILLALAVLFAPCKIIYVFLCFMVFLIPWAKAGSKKKFAIGTGCVLGGGVLSVLLVRLMDMMYYVGRDSNALSYVEQSGFTLGTVLQMPMATIRLVYDTIRTYGSYYMETMVGKYMSWLDIPIQEIWIFLFFIFMLLSVCCIEGQKQYMKGKDKTLLVCIVLAVYFALLGVFLISWTPLSSPVIEGMQGRYLLPILPLFLLLFQNKWVVIKGNMQPVIALGVGIIQFYVVWEIFETILLR